MILNSKDIKKGKEYPFKQLEEFANHNNYSITEHGGNSVGKNFLVLEHNDKDIVISFMLNGYGQVSGHIYQCVYSDL